MSGKVTRYRLAQRPGDGAEAAWSVTHDSAPAVGDGQVHLALDYLSVDPAMRGWITDKRSYIEPVRIGEVMRAFGVGRVVASNSKHFKPGDYATGLLGVQTEAVVDGRELRKVDPGLAQLQHYLSGLGMTGFTAYFGLLDLGRPGPEDTVVVSSAAGAVGSIVAQIAKLKAKRVIGIAGGPKKCAYLLDELGLDAAIDYKCEDINAALRKATPGGIDVYFDNVGGETLDAVLGQINRHARIVLCGAVSQYGDLQKVRGPSNYMALITHSGCMQGFTMKDYLHRIPEAFAAMYQWREQGKLKFREHILEGIDQFPKAFGMLLRGENFGKLLIKI